MEGINSLESIEIYIYDSIVKTNFDKILIMDFFVKFQ